MNNEFLQLLSEAKMSSQELNKVLADPDIKLGYEIEFFGWDVPDKVGKTFEQMLENKNFSLNYERTNVEVIIDQEAMIYLQNVYSRPDEIIEFLTVGYKEANKKWKEFYTPTELKNMLTNFAANKKNAKKIGAILEKQIKKMFYKKYSDPGLSFLWQAPYDTYVAELVKQNKNYITKLDIDFYDDENDLEVPRRGYKFFPIISVQSYFAQNANIDFGKNGWELTSDLSLTPNANNQRRSEGYELISPPMEIAVAINKLKEIFDLMTKAKFYTNDTCGLHMGISFKNKKETKQADPLKLIMFLGENYLLNLFNRTKNEYTEPHSYTISHRLQTESDLHKIFKAKSVQQFLKKVTDKLSREKYSSVNLKKMALGYFEIRIAGNKNYEKNFDLVRSTALRYGRALQISLSDEYKKEYLKKVYKFLMNVFGVTPELEADVEKPLKDIMLNIYNLLLGSADYQDKSDLQRLTRDFVLSVKDRSKGYIAKTRDISSYLADYLIYDPNKNQAMNIARVAMAIKNVPGMDNALWNKYFRKILIEAMKEVKQFKK